MDRDALTRLREDPIDWRYKGFPADLPAATPATVAERGWNLLARDLPTPVMVLKEHALAHNLELMARYCEKRGVLLAPHGKTTMSPELWSRQLDAGAFGITAGNLAQVRVCRAFGVDRVILANQLLEPAALRYVAGELAGDPGFDFYCLADSVESVEAMTRGLGHTPRPIAILVELGVAGARTGARTLDEAREVARAVAASPALELAGVEGFEGIIAGDDAIPRTRRFVSELRSLLETLDFGGREPMVTAGGSVFFDLVCEGLDGAPAQIVLRSGCYLTQDVGYYEELSPLGGRSPDGEQLENALEVWGVVLSRPEPEIALALMGKRDLAYDLEPPIPLHVHDRHGLRGIRGTMTVYDLNDQHAYVRVPADDRLSVGDLLACGISHPCTAFDKWRLVPIVDDDYTVVDAVHTFF